MKKVNTQKRFAPKLKIKKGDKVVVISGASSGKEGNVIEVYPKESRVLVEGVNMVKKHTKPNAQNQQGGIVEQEASIHISNVKLLVAGKPTRVGRKVAEDGKIVRFAKKTGEVI
ncbi:MAG: 50S ribosomal protein L24 [Sphingobacteriales bacterium]|jgi:large subunit ribosomal protein L24|nr:MAG: 50S ribosomal protein L24 [Sphingobacteriales bacterium]